MMNPTKEISEITDTATGALSDGAAEINSALGAVVDVAADAAKAAAAVAAIPGVSSPRMASRAFGFLKRHPKFLILSLLIAAGVAWKRSSEDSP